MLLSATKKKKFTETDGYEFCFLQIVGIFLSFFLNRVHENIENSRRYWVNL